MLRNCLVCVQALILLCSFQKTLHRSGNKKYFTYALVLIFLTFGFICPICGSRHYNASCLYLNILKNKNMGFCGLSMWDFLDILFLSNLMIKLTISLLLSQLFVTILSHNINDWRLCLVAIDLAPILLLFIIKVYQYLCFCGDENYSIVIVYY